MSYFVMLHVNMHHFRAKVSKGLLGSDGAHGAGESFFPVLMKRKFLLDLISFRLILFKTI